MKYRKLRIAWSVAWGIMAVLLVALWVRSRYAMDDIMGPLPWSRGFGAMSRSGGIGLLIHRGEGSLHWNLRTQPAHEVILPYQTALGFVQYLTTADSYRVRVPDWSLLLLLAALTVSPWIEHFKWRFSLRTLLVATTLVAVGLGLIVWLTR
jgi:hypothetical protein